MEEVKEGKARLADAIIKKLEAKVEGEPDEEVEQGREDLMQAFQDFDNKELPTSERMDALKFFFDLSSKSGKTKFPDEE